MKYITMSLFPEMIQNYMSASITGRALKKNVISLENVNIRDFTLNKNNRVDDYIYGGGAGMLMQAEPVWRCYEYVKTRMQGNTRVLFMSPQGKTFNQSMANALSKNDTLVFLCGHYEGIDQRVLDMINPTYVSLGDFVLTGGELPAMAMMDAVTRLIPGALGSDDSAVYESFYDGLLEYPQYTRPEEFMGEHVPEVLLTGNHKLIEEWKRKTAIENTRLRRPDMYDKYMLSHPEPEKKKRRNRKNK